MPKCQIMVYSPDTEQMSETALPMLSKCTGDKVPKRGPHTVSLEELGSSRFIAAGECICRARGTELAWGGWVRSGQGKAVLREENGEKWVPLADRKQGLGRATYSSMLFLRS